MKSRSFFVVGDKFHEFAKGKDVLTVGQLKALSRLPHRLLDTRHVLMLGQGVPDDEVLAILRSHESQPELAAHFEISDLRRSLTRAASGLSHKHFSHNTVIGTPVRKAADSFELPLLLDERCELMGDHQTGQHVQGMLLVEAFRQSFLAVTEAFFPFGDEPTYFVINSMHIEFQNFVFPLPAHVDYRVVDADVNPRRARYAAAMSVIQEGASCASAAIGFTVYSAQTIAQKEAELAARATDRLLAQVQAPAAAPDAQAKETALEPAL